MAAGVIASDSGDDNHGAAVDVSKGNSTVRCPPEALDVRGLFDLPEDGIVSSLALTPDGCYVFAGFGGGEVRLYAQALRTVGAASRSGTIVAQIKSKVRVSDELGQTRGRKAARTVFFHPYSPVGDDFRHVSVGRSLILNVGV